MKYLSALSASCTLLVALAVPAAAQAPLSLRDALARADSVAYPNRVARAQVARAGADHDATLAGVLPSARLEAGYTRSTDPLVAFGFLLRQRGVTTASFDPDLLNNPAARGDVQTGFAAEVPLVNLDAWSARSATSRAAEAEMARADWTRSGVQLRVTEAWAGAVVAQERVYMLEAAHGAAGSHVRQAERLANQGMVTRSDVLLASVRQGELEAQLEAARGEREIALRHLALAIGTPEDTTLRVPDSLPTLAVARAGTSPASVRSDVQAAHLAREAADAGAERAGRALLPRLNGFGRYDWHDANTPFGGKGMWTAGVQLSWSPFTSAREVAARGAAQADAAAARDAAELAEATAALELAQARIRAQVAERSLVIAERAVSQGVEAHRIVGRKYEGGLVTISDLLDAAALETSTRLGLARARYGVLVTRGVLLRAGGLDLAALAEAIESEGRTTP
jgi:outer membrane protein TolC